MSYIDFTSHKNTPRQRDVRPAGGVVLTTPNIDRHKKVRLPTFPLKLFYLVGLVILLWWLIFASPFMKVSDLEIKGDVTDQLKQDLSELKGKNIFFLGGSGTEKRIKQSMPEIKRATIIRGIPHRVVIQIVEREPALIWSTQNTNFLIDKDGVAFKQAGGVDLPRVVDNSNIAIKLGSVATSTSFVDVVRSIYASYEQMVGKKIDHIEINETTIQATVVTDSGIKHLLDTSRGLTPQFVAAKKVLDEKGGEIKEYIDTRVEGMVYYK